MTFADSRLLDRLGGAVCTLGGLALAASVVPFGREIYWALELPGHFRPQLALVLMAASLGMLLLRKRILAVVFLGASLANATVLLPFLLNPPPAAAPDAPQVRMVLFNVNSSIGDPQAVRAYLEAEDFDLVVLQEYSSRWKSALHSLPYSHRLERVREDNFGMAVFSRVPLSDREVLLLGDAEVPSLRVTFSIGETPLVLLASHPVPPVNGQYTAWRDQQLAVLPEHCPPDTPLLLAGDFNTTPWSPQLWALRQRTGLIDSATGFGFQPTWPARFPPLWTVLDHVYHSRHLLVVNRKTGPSCGSDHVPVEVTVALR